MNDVLKQTESKMKRTVDLLVKDYTTMRAGRATPALLEKVFADYYGTPTPINQMATISVPESRLLVIQPWDRNMVPQIEKAILKSDLGITPEFYSCCSSSSICSPCFASKTASAIFEVSRRTALMASSLPGIT